MGFACQKNSFLTEFETKVSTCEESKINSFSNGKKILLDGYDVTLEDTIIFPEGGGQPCDYGFINDIRVENVRRIGDKAVHFVESPLTEGQTVTVRIDWDRRFDHMQQHSGQHLITAIADQEFGYPTTSWWLGQDISHIELDTASVKQKEIECLEKKVNEFIRNSTPVTVAEYDEDNPLPKDVRTRGLPDDHQGSIRVVTIKGLENNMCCGTHVNNLSQLQVIKLLKAEKGKKGKVNLEFLVGGRVLKQLSTMYEREANLSNLLKNAPQVHAELVEKLQKSLKVANKNLSAVLKELAIHEAKALMNASPKPKFHVIHRPEPELDFGNVFIREVNTEEILLLLTFGEDKGMGQIILYGKPDVVSNLGPQICSLLDGKGAGKGPKFQAKVKNLANKDKAANVIKDYYCNLSD